MTTDVKLSLPIPLDEPIIRGKQTIDSIQIRKPGASELRGLSAVTLSTLEFDAIAKILPRISVPPLTEAEVAQLGADTMLDVSEELASFLSSKRRRERAAAMSSQELSPTLQ